MAREAFRDKKFSAASLAMIARCDEIVEEYTAQGLRLTLRQLYYQLVSRDVIPNVEKSYKNLSTLVRVPTLGAVWAGVPAALEVALQDPVADPPPLAAPLRPRPAQRLVLPGDGCLELHALLHQPREACADVRVATPIRLVPLLGARQRGDLGLGEVALDLLELVLGLLEARQRVVGAGHQT